MSAVGDVLNQLGQVTIPQVAAIVFPDTMDVIELANTQDSGGANIKAQSTVYSSVPVSYEMTSNAKRLPVADQHKSIVQYTLTMPTHQSGGRINLNPAKHRLKVLTRGNEPEKLFRIIGINDVSGVVFEAICERVNV